MSRYLILLLAALLHWAALPGWAQQRQRPGGDSMSEAYLKEQARRQSDKFLDGATTLEQWQAQRPRLHQEFLDMLGLWPLPERTPLHATITGTIERHGVRIEKLHFQSRPGLYVTCALFRPKEVAGKLPAILYQCGHSPMGRDGNKTAYQDHGFWFAKHGYVCLMMDTLEYGEITGVHHGTCNLGRFWWQARGYTPAGVECWNAIRALDYLTSRPDVDAERIGATGISGGGIGTVWVAAADDRVKVAAEVSGISDLETYVTDRVLTGHCDCVFLVNTYQWEWTTIQALIAPRPYLFVNSDQDGITPMPGNRRIIARLRQLYQLYDKPQLVDEYVSHGAHAYRPDLRIAVFKFLNKHLKNETGPVADADYEKIPGPDLRVFPTDSDLPPDALNASIDETFVPQGTVTLPAAQDFAVWQADLLRRLRQRSFRPFPESVPAAKRIREEPRDDGSVIERLATEGPITVALSRPAAKGEGKGALGTLLVRDRDDVDTDGRLLKEYGGDGPVRILTVRPGRPETIPNYVQRSYVLVGRTVDGGRVWDVLSTIRYLQERGSPGRSWRVVGRGTSGIIAVYAALLEPAISSVVVLDPPPTHRDGPIFLNVLQVLDVPEALGLLAPRSLTLVGARDKAFERTAAIYQRAGAKAHLQRK